MRYSGPKTLRQAAMARKAMDARGIGRGGATWADLAALDATFAAVRRNLTGNTTQIVTCAHNVPRGTSDAADAPSPD